MSSHVYLQRVECSYTGYEMFSFNTLGPRQHIRYLAEEVHKIKKCVFVNEYVRYSADEFLKCNFLYENTILIQIPLIVPKCTIDNKSELIQVMAWLWAW